MERGAIITAVAALLIKSETNMVMINNIANNQTTLTSIKFEERKVAKEAVNPEVVKASPIGIIAPNITTTGHSMCL